MSLFNWFSRSTKIVNDVFDKDNGLITQLGSFVGNQNLTAEEAMEANVSVISTAVEHAKNTLSENTERSKTRRAIAEKFVNFYLNWASVGFAGWFLLPEYSVWLLSILTGLAFGGAFTAIIVFHFGSYGLHRHNESKK